MDEKAKVSQQLSRKSVSKKITYGENVTQMMGNDQTFNSMNAQIAIAEQATTNLGTSKNAKDAAEAAAKAATSDQYEKEEAFIEAFNVLGSGVDIIAKGEKEIIDLSGMDSFFPGKAAPIGDLTIVENLSATEGDKQAEIDLHWDSLKGANSYLIQVSVGDPNTWEYSGNSTKSNYTAGGLQSGSVYWFRVTGIGAAGQGPFSDPATKVAP